MDDERLRIRGGLQCWQHAKLVIVKATASRRAEILRFLLDRGIDLGALGGMQPLGEQLDRCRLLVSGRGAAKRTNTTDSDDQYGFLDLAPEDLYRACKLAGKGARVIVKVLGITRVLSFHTQERWRCRPSPSRCLPR